LSQKEATNSAAPRTAPNAPPSPNWQTYLSGGNRGVNFDLQSDSDKRPRVSRVVTPYYPQELLDEKVAGDVVLDVQVTDEGKVGGVWLVSATPEIFSTLATSAVRQWEFEAIATKIRVILKFQP
jgi:TonB family protein